MNIGEFSRQAGVNAQTVRFYEREGLLPPPLREGSGRYRCYEAEDLERLQFILLAKASGFTLKDIRVLLDQDLDSASCESIQNLLRERLNHVEEKIDKLEQFRGSLSRMLERCRDNPKDKPCSTVQAFRSLT